MRAVDVLPFYEKVKTSFADRDASVITNREFALGNQWSARELAELPEGVEPVTLNYIYPIVLKNVTFFVGRPPEISVPLVEDNPEAREYAQWMEKVFYGLWEANRMKRRFTDMAWNCSVGGGQPCLIDWNPVTRLPVYSFPQPERCYAVPATDDDSMTAERYAVELFFSPEYMADRHGGSPEDWSTDHWDGGMDFCTVVRYGDARDHYWVQKSTGRLLDHRSGYGWVNYVYFPNISVAGGIDGLADVTLLRNLQRQLNQWLTMQADVLAMYADPPVIIEGGGDFDPNKVAWGPGMKIPIMQGGRVYFLAWEGTPPDFREHIQSLITAMQDLSGMPDVTFGRYEASIQSGIALNTQFQPTRLLMAVKQNGWTDAFGELHRMSIQLMRDKLGDKPVDLFGMRPAGMKSEGVPFSLQVKAEDFNGYVRTDIVWPGMLPKDDATENAGLLNDFTGGAISLYSLLEKRGFESPQQEITRIKEERSDPILHPELVPPPVAAPAAAAPSAPAMPPGMDGLAAMMSGAAGMGGPEGVSAPGMVPGVGSDMSNVSSEAAYAGRDSGIPTS